MNSRFLDYAPVPAWRASLKSGIRRLGAGRDGDRGQLRPRAQPELGEDVLEMSLHRVTGQEQPAGDLRVGMTLGRERHDPPLALGERRPSHVVGPWHRGPGPLRRGGPGRRDVVDEADDRLHDRLRVAGPGQVVPAGNDPQDGAGDRVGHRPGVAQRDHVLLAVHDKRRHLQCGEQVTHIGAAHGLDQRRHHSRAGRSPLEGPRSIAVYRADQAGTNQLTIRLPFGDAHLPAGALVPAGHAATVSAGADPFVQEALRWLPGTAQDGGGTGARPVHEEITPGNDSDPSAQAGRALPARVLVADDNADMREYLARLLRSAGYRVTTVTDGQAALDAVRAGAPDLVISDVMMPRLDGLGLVAALRADARTAAVPVLLLSARAGQEASIEGLRAGADDYLVKPFSAAELLARARASVELVRFRNRESQFRRTLIDSLQEGFFLTDQEGTILEANQAFLGLVGYSPDGCRSAGRTPGFQTPALTPAGGR